MYRCDNLTFVLRFVKVTDESMHGECAAAVRWMVDGTGHKYSPCMIVVHSMDGHVQSQFSVAQTICGLWHYK